MPGDYPTIQEGLNAASSGDTVLVAPGTYTENIVWPLVDGIRLFSELGADTTVVDGSSAGSVVYFSGMAVIDTTTVIRGLTIQNGSGVEYGGGINLVNSSPKIEDNIVENNSATRGGGGISCTDFSSPLIVGNTIRNDSASGTGMSYGGGIYSLHSRPTIAGNQITGNSAYAGGGISCWECNPTISNNTIRNNSASDVGGGIYCGFSHPTITGNVISNNSAESGAGGISCGYSHPTIASNTISNNSGSSSGGISCYRSDPMITGDTISSNSGRYSGGLYCDHSNSTITNNTIVGNSSLTNGGGILCANQSNPLIRHNIIAQNDAGGYGDGIYCERMSFPDVGCNNIYNNGYGAYNAESLQVLTADYNWWGDPSGPYHPSLNPGGLGDSTNMFVDPMPWLTDPVAGDVGTASVGEPPDTVACDDTVSVIALVCNYGTLVDMFDVGAFIDSSGIPVYADTQTVLDLAPGACDTVGFASWVVPPIHGVSYTVMVTTLLPCDIDPTNDTASKEALAWCPGVEEIVSIAVLPSAHSLGQSRPNPARGWTRIDYQLSAKSTVCLRVYDLKGTVVKTLVEGFEEGGYKTVVWDGRDDRGVRVASGIYFYRLAAADPALSGTEVFTATKKMVVIR